MLKNTLLAVLFLAVYTSSFAASYNSIDGINANKRDAEVQSAIRWVKKNYNGRVLSAKAVKGDAGRQVRVKLITPGGVVKIIVVTLGGG